MCRLIVTLSFIQCNPVSSSYFNTEAIATLIQLKLKLGWESIIDDERAMYSWLTKIGHAAVRRLQRLIITVSEDDLFYFNKLCSLFTGMN